MEDLGVCGTRKFTNHDVGRVKSRKECEFANKVEEMLEINKTTVFNYFKNQVDFHVSR